MARKVLMIVYYYPPLGGIGGMRTLRLASRLPSLGWEPIVLTVSEGTLAVIERDASDGEIPGVRVFRTFNPDLAFRVKRLAGFDVSQKVSRASRGAAAPASLKARLATGLSDWAGMPDRFIDWFPFARRRAIELVRTFAPEVVFTSSPPSTCHIIAASVKSRTGVPWVADLRDPWIGRFYSEGHGLPNMVNSWLDKLLDKTLFRMSWYFTHVGVLLFAVGLAIFVVKGLKFKTFSLFLICGFFAALLFYRAACNPLHFWYIRRYMPAVVPFMAGLMAYAVVKTPTLFKDRQVRKMMGGIGMAALLVVLVFSGIYTAKVYPVVQYEGALKSITDLNAQVGGGDTGVIFYGKWGFVYYTDLMRYLLGVDAVPLVGANGDPRLFDAVYAKMKAKDKKVFLVGSGDLIPHATSNLVLQPVDSVIVSMKVLLPQYDVRPGEVVDFGFPLYVYELKDRGSIDTFSVHIGGADTIAVQSGFYAPEVSKARWTAGSAAFHLPDLGGQDRLALTMDIALGSRPLNPGEVVPMKVYAGGSLVGEVALDSADFKAYTVEFDRSALPQGKARNIEFRIEVPTWTPAAVAGKPADTRLLGVTMDGVTLKPAAR